MNEIITIKTLFSHLSDCGLTCHAKCELKVPSTCVGSTTEVSDSSSIQSKPALVASPTLTALEGIESMDLKAEVDRALPTHLSKDCLTKLTDISTGTKFERVAIVLYDYNSSQGEELPLTKGQVLQIANVENEMEGWIMVSVIIS